MKKLIPAAAVVTALAVVAPAVAFWNLQEHPRSAPTRSSPQAQQPQGPDLGDAGTTMESFAFEVSFDQLLKGPVVRTAADAYANAAGIGQKTNDKGIFKLVSATFTMTETADVESTTGAHVPCDHAWYKKCYHIQFEGTLTRNHPDSRTALLNMSWCGAGYDAGGAILRLRDAADCANYDGVGLNWSPLHPTLIAGEEAWALAGAATTVSRPDGVMKGLKYLGIKVSTGWARPRAEIALDVLHERVAAPESTLHLVAVVWNKGTVPLDMSRLRVSIDVEVGESPPAGFRGKEAWVKDFDELDIHLQRESSTDPGGSSWFARAEMTVQRRIIVLPGDGILLPPVNVKAGKKPGRFQVLGTATLRPLQDARYTGSYQVTDVTKPCPEGRWEIAGKAESAGFVVGGEHWDWTATCILKDDLKVVGDFKFVEAGVLVDLGGSEANFKGIIQDAPYASDLAGWFSGVAAQLGVDAGLVSASGGAVYAHWYSANTNMRVILWWGEVTDEVVKKAAEKTVGDAEAEAVNHALRGLLPAEPWKAGGRQICGGTAGKGLSKLLQGKACGFWGYSSVGGV